MPKPPDDDDDDFELELEPVDPEILAHERQRAEEKTEAVVGSIDVDELYREQDRDYEGLDVDWSRFTAIRFTTRHLMAATALLAIVLTVHTQAGGCNAFLMVAVTVVAGGWFYVMQVERKRDAERARRKEEFFASSKKGSVAATGGGGDVTFAPEPGAAPEAPRPRFDFKFSFSTKELLITVTICAVALAIIRYVGADRMAIILGLIALVGLIVQAAGFDAPRLLVLGWWMLLVFYLIVGLIAALSDSDEDSKAYRQVPSSVLIAVT